MTRPYSSSKHVFHPSSSSNTFPEFFGHFGEFFGRMKFVSPLFTISPFPEWRTVLNFELKEFLKELTVIRSSDGSFSWGNLLTFFTIFSHHDMKSLVLESQQGKFSILLFVLIIFVFARFFVDLWILNLPTIGVWSWVISHLLNQSSLWMFNTTWVELCMMYDNYWSQRKLLHLYYCNVMLILNTDLF